MDSLLTSKNLLLHIKEDNIIQLLNSIYLEHKEKSIMTYNTIIQNSKNIENLFNYLVDTSNKEYWEEILNFLITNFKECKNNLFVFLIIKSKTGTFFKVLISMLFELFKIEEDLENNNIPTQTSNSEENKIFNFERGFGTTKIKKITAKIYSLIELVLNNFTINKSDLEVVYQELAKFYHNKEQYNLTKDKSIKYIELFKVKISKI